MDEDETPKPIGQVIQIDEGRIRDRLGEMVHGTVEEALNAMLDAEADQLCGRAGTAVLAGRVRIASRVSDAWNADRLGAFGDCNI